MPSWEGVPTAVRCGERGAWGGCCGERGACEGGALGHRCGDCEPSQLTAG